MRGRLTQLLGVALICGGVLMAGGAATTAHAADVVLIAAGDISNCNNNNDEATAKLLDSMGGTIAVLGDNAYSSGSTYEYRNCYHPTWGRHKARTYPIPGNHEYLSNGAGPYFDYFGSRAGERGKGYYSYTLGSWRIIALNSEISVSAGSTQERWLRNELASNQRDCTLVYFHKPLVSSGEHGNNSAMKPLWNAMYQYGVDVVLNGHDHNYERFAPMNPDGRADSKGIRQFVIGTGGTSLRGWGSIRPNSAARNNTDHGVVKFTLRDGGYSWSFVPVAGKSYRDSGEAACVKPGASSGDLRVSSLSLIDADRDTVIGTLHNGDTLDLSALPTRRLSIRANTSPARVGSVRFALNGSPLRIENAAPYTIAGDGSSGSDYYGWTPAVGRHTLTVTPYAAAQAGGTVGAPLSVTFTVVE